MEETSLNRIVAAPFRATETSESMVLGETLRSLPLQKTTLLSAESKLFDSELNLREMILQNLILYILQSMETRGSCGQSVKPDFPLSNSYLLETANSLLLSHTAVLSEFYSSFSALYLCCEPLLGSDHPSTFYSGLGYSKYLCMMGDILLSLPCHQANSGFVPCFRSSEFDSCVSEPMSKTKYSGPSNCYS